MANILRLNGQKVVSEGLDLGKVSETANEPYRLPYFFEVQNVESTDGTQNTVKVIAHTVTLDGKKTDGQFDLSAMILSTSRATGVPTINSIAIKDKIFNLPEGGSGGTSDYSALSNKPKINDVELDGNKSLNDLKIVGLLGNEKVSGQPYHFPYHFTATFDNTTRKLNVKLWTITLDNEKTLVQYEQEVHIPGGGAVWGEITGTINNQKDLMDLIDGKQATLVSGTNIKTVNSQSLLGNGDITISGEPSAYLKSASVSDNTLTLTNKDDSTVVYTPTIDLSAYRTSAAQDVIDASKQATLVSGTNIKTINGNSVLGSGDITVSGEPAAYLKSADVSTTNTLKLKNKDNTDTTFTVDLSSKQDTLSTAQLNACNSGATTTNIAQIATNTTAIGTKLDASKCTITTTAPTSAATDGGVHIVYLTAEPATKYDGYIYLIKE